MPRLYVFRHEASPSCSLGVVRRGFEKQRRIQRETERLRLTKEEKRKKERKEKDKNAALLPWK